MNDSNKEYRSRMSKNGLITLAVVAVLLVILIAVNLVASALPADVKNIDMTDNKMYSVTDSTKRELAKTDTAVNIYLICQGGEAALADTGVHLDVFLDNLAAVSNKITYTLIDPLVKTDFLAKYDFGTDVSDLSVIVESALRSRLIPASDFFSYYIDGVGKITETNALYYYYYYGLTPSYVFDGESLLLGAVSYVTAVGLPTVYALSGHSETALTDTLTEQLDAANIHTSTVTLTGLSTLPDDCDMLIINAPQTDITEEEATLLLSYLKAGGAIMMVTTPDAAAFPNLGKVAAAMGLSAEQGIVIETDSSHYYNAQAPYYLIPEIGSHTVTESGSTVILPFAHGINIADSLPTGLNVTPLYTTSSGAYTIAIDAETVQMPEGAEARSICVGAVAENAANGKLIWIASNGFTVDSMNQAISGGNYATFVACANWVCGESDIPSASPLALTTGTLSVSATSAGLLSVILIFLIPLLFVGYGLFCVIRRKRR